jgi:2-keto-4-pentenoate hydratase
VSETLQDPRIRNGMRAQMEVRARLLDGGAKQIGWKVGLGAPAMQTRCKLTAPVVGFLLDRAELSSGAEISLNGWQKPVAEAEIAAYMGRDLPAGASREEVRRAIAAVGPAIELADVDCAMDEVETVLSGNIFQRHVILGPRDAMRSGARLDGLKGQVTRSGQDVPVPADLETNIGEVVNIVRHVADIADAVGGGLRAGHFIICGSLTPPMFLDPNERAIDFELSPIGRVGVRFSAQAESDSSNGTFGHS